MGEGFDKTLLSIAPSVAPDGTEYATDTGAPMTGETASSAVATASTPLITARPITDSRRF
jgi:hypothetical protein